VTRRTTTRAPSANKVASVTTTAPVHAVRGGVSLLAGPALLILVLIPILGIVLWLSARAYGLNWLGLLMGGTFIALAVAVHDHTQARQKWMRRQGAWSLGWTGAVLGWVTAFGPDPMWAGLTLATGIPLTAWWFFAKTEPYRGNGSDGHGGDDGAWQRSVGLAETTKPVKVKDEHGERHVEVEHTDNTGDDLVKAKDKIEAKGRLPKGSVRVEPFFQAGRVLAHKSRLVISRSNRLEEIGDWTGPDRPGAGVWDPILLGLCADGKPSEWVMTPTEDSPGSPALMSSGQSGAAKTAFQLNLLGSLVARQGVVLWASDTRKSGQWVPFVRPFIDWLATTPEEAKLQLDAMSAAVPVRTQLITDLTGEDRWTPACWTEHGIPFLLWWGAEAAPLMGVLEEELTRLNEVIRSAGGKLTPELQRPSESNVSTDFRNLIPESVAFRCDKPEDGRMALKEETLDAGAEPWTFSEDMPGMHYAEFANEKQSRRAIKRRTYKPDRLRLAASVAEWMCEHPEWHRLDEQTAAAVDAATRGAYRRRATVPLTSWLGSQYGKPPQLRDPSIVQWIEKAKQQQPAPVPVPAPQEEQMPPDDDENPDLAMAEYEQDTDGHEHEDKEIAMEAARVLEQVEAEVRQEEGPYDPDDVPVRDLAGTLAELSEPHDGDDDPDLDWSPHAPKEPRPSPQQRAVNFQALVRRLFTDTDLRREDSELRASVVEQIDGRWAVAATETLVAIWLGFDGEDVRPALYPRLRAHARRGLARQLQRGEWAISERALAEPLVIPDDYDPDDEPASEDEDDATLRDLAGVEG
jgi:hypothetical protein